MKTFGAICLGLVAYIAVRAVGIALGYDPSFGEATVIILAVLLSNFIYEAAS
jgi:hypothetical protein